MLLPKSNVSRNLTYKARIPLHWTFGYLTDFFQNSFFFHAALKNFCDAKWPWFKNWFCNTSKMISSTHSRRHNTPGSCQRGVLPPKGLRKTVKNKQHSAFHQRSHYFAISKPVLLEETPLAISSTGQGILMFSLDSKTLIPESIFKLSS